MTTRRLIPAVLGPILILPLIGWCATRETGDARYEEFLRLAQSDKQEEALDLGGRLFQSLVAQNPDSAALALLVRRLDAARQIDTLVRRAVQPSPAKLLEGITALDDLGPVPPAARNPAVPAVLPPPAQELYWTHVSTFTGEPALDGLSAPQSAFLGRYYQLQMQNFILKIARQALVADPKSVENACYAAVLPLLYLHGRDHAWAQMGPFLALFSADQLGVLWRFALLQTERLAAAAEIARYQRNATGTEFSLALWASEAASACVANHRPDLARQSLQMAIDGAKDREQVALLRLKAAEGYARCGDYATATQMCRQIAEDLPDASSYGRVRALYFAYLAREAKVEPIITETESALQDARCKPYLPQILYLRWWALYKTNRLDEAVPIAQRLIEQYPGHACVAPVLLERATEALAHQQYDKCRELLAKLAKDFPGTESAARAEEIQVRLRASLPETATENRP